MVGKCVAHLNSLEVFIGSQVPLASLSFVAAKCCAFLGNFVCFCLVGTSALRGCQVREQLFGFICSRVPLAPLKCVVVKCVALLGDLVLSICSQGSLAPLICVVVKCAALLHSLVVSICSGAVDTS